MANPVTGAPEVFATEAAQTLVENGNGGAPVHVEPELWGLAPFQIVSISMLVLLLFAFFGAKVHKKLAGGIDGKIAAIKEQLEEAKQLRAEAETLREEYARKIAGAEKDAEAMLANARHEADACANALSVADLALRIVRAQKLSAPIPKEGISCAGAMNILQRPGG